MSSSVASAATSDARSRESHNLLDPPLESRQSPLSRNQLNKVTLVTEINLYFLSSGLRHQKERNPPIHSDTMYERERISRF